VNATVSTAFFLQPSEKQNTQAITKNRILVARIRVSPSDLDAIPAAIGDGNLDIGHTGAQRLLEYAIQIMDC